MTPADLPTPAGRPLVIAHRGASAYAADNSLEAFRIAVDQGADGIEVDARFTADSRIVLHHDAVVAGFGPIIARTLAELRSDKPEVTTLDEMLPVSGDTILNIEIKNHPRDPDFDPDHRMADAVVAWVVDNAVTRRTLVSSFNPATVERVRAAGAGVVTGLLLEHGVGLVDEMDRASRQGHRWILPRHTRWRLRPKRMVARAHEAGLSAGTWTVDEPGALRRLRRAGIDAVITNDPQGALAVYG
jgi:glycerophosphoryl diester phosphodiesterase